MSKREVKMTDWCLGFRKTLKGFIVCLEGTPTDSKQIWSSTVMKNFIDKGIIETTNTRYAVCGQPTNFYTVRVRVFPASKHQYEFHAYDREKSINVGNVYHLGHNVWYFKSKYYPSLWACQVAADLYVLRRKVRELNK